MGLLDALRRARRPIDRAEQEARGFRPLGYTGKYRLVEDEQPDIPSPPR